VCVAAFLILGLFWAYSGLILGLFVLRAFLILGLFWAYSGLICENKIPWAPRILCLLPMDQICIEGTLVLLNKFFSPIEEDCKSPLIAPKYQMDFAQLLIDLIFQPGSSLKLVPVINVTVLCLLALMIYLSYTSIAMIHIIIMSSLSMGLLMSVNWYLDINSCVCF
jgi:hypothetical protein